MTRLCLTCQGRVSVCCPDLGHKIEDYPMQMRGKSWTDDELDYGAWVAITFCAGAFCGLMAYAVVKLWTG